MRDLFTEHMRDLGQAARGLPADVLVGKFNKAISFTLRRGAIAHVTAVLNAAQRAA